MAMVARDGMGICADASHGRGLNKRLYFFRGSALLSFIPHSQNSLK